jgi:hypothetical protein
MVPPLAGTLFRVGLPRSRHEPLMVTSRPRQARNGNYDGHDAIAGLLVVGDFIRVVIGAQIPALLGDEGVGFLLLTLLFGAAHGSLTAGEG